MKQQSFRRDIIWNTIGSVISGFVVFVLTVLITRVNGIQASGQFGFAFSVAAIFSTIAYYGGRNYQITDVKGEFRQSEYIKLRIATSAFAFMALSVFLFINNFSTHLVWLVVILMGYRTLDAVSDVLYGVLQVHNRLYLAGISNFIKSSISLIGFFIVDLATRNICAASLVFLVTYILGIVFIDLPNVHQLGNLNISLTGKWNTKQIALKLLPFAVIVLLPNVITNISKYFIQLWHPGQQGYFNIIVLPLFFLTLVVYFVVAPLLTPLARELHEERTDTFVKHVRQVFLLVILFGTALLPITYFLAPWVLKIVFGINFVTYRAQICFVVISGVIYTLAIFSGDVLLILRKLKQQVLILLSVTILNISLSAMLIRNYGINGAIAVSIISNILWVSLLWTVYYITMKNRQPHAK